MRKFLLLALLLYDIVFATRPMYDYEDVGGDVGKLRHLSLEDKRREWRRKSNLKDMEHKEWEDRSRRHDYDQRYFDEMEKNFVDKGLGQERGMDRLRENEINYRRRYEDIDKLSMGMGMPKSSEIGHPPTQYVEKEPEKKLLSLSCERPHERYDACFAGCAAVSCDNPRDRLRSCYPFCEPGCVCIPPYVRDDRTHKCVLADDCTKGLKGIPDLGDES